MIPKLSGKELLGDIGKVLALLILVLWVCSMLLFLFCRSFPFVGAKTPVIPNFSFDNVGPCLEPTQKIVEKFKVGDEQYICADMVSNESPVFLELYVFTNDKQEQVYVEGGTFTSGHISFAIYPPLPPGKYWAYISWSRPALVNFTFEVVAK